MNVVEMVEKTMAEGVRFKMTMDGKLKLGGPDHVITSMLPDIQGQ